jgi:hypothetical protein
VAASSGKTGKAEATAPPARRHLSRPGARPAWAWVLEATFYTLVVPLFGFHAYQCSVGGAFLAAAAHDGIAAARHKAHDVVLLS